jgi:hypothetical protein
MLSTIVTVVVWLASKASRDPISRHPGATGSISILTTRQVVDQPTSGNSYHQSHHSASVRWLIALMY